MGKLYLSQGSVGSGSNISVCKTNIEGAQSKIESITEKINKQEKEKKEKEDQKNRISEQIGATKSKAQYEAMRKDFIRHRDNALDNENACSKKILVMRYQINFHKC